MRHDIRSESGCNKSYGGDISPLYQTCLYQTPASETGSNLDLTVVI